MWLNGDADDGPKAVGLSIADMLAGHVLVEGILAALVRRGIGGKGALVVTSLPEALVDFQFEVLTTHLTDGGNLLCPAPTDNANTHLAAHYGDHSTTDAFLTLALMHLAPPRHPRELARASGEERGSKEG